MPCPAGIDIPGLFKTVNEGLDKTYFAALDDYKKIPVRADSCKKCGACEKKCPHGAVIVADNHAVIDYDKCTSCGTCVDACPRKCLVRTDCIHLAK